MALYDTIVVGAGINGLSTAYHLAKMNKKTLLLEQFGLPHSRGSSHGQSRVTRYAYSQDHYIRMMEDAFPMWSQLEKETGTTLFTPCGVLILEKSPYNGLEGRKKALVKANKPIQEFTPEEASRRYPGMRPCEGYRIVLDESAGSLRADKALLCFQSRFKELGGSLHDEEAVRQIIPGRIVTVVTTKARYRAKSIVITPGPWASKILHPLGLHIPLTTYRIRVFYWRVKYGAFDKHPCIIDDTRGDRHIYTVPEHEYPGLVKVVMHGGTASDPDSRDAVSLDGFEIPLLQKFLQEVLPGLDSSAPVIEESCIYTVTPDMEVVIDRHPSHPNIIIGCGFSGHGFKLAPATGKALAELASGREPSYDMKPLSISRFGKGVLTKSNL